MSQGFGEGHQPEWTTNPQVYHPNLPPAPPPKVRVENQGQAPPKLPPRPQPEDPPHSNDSGQLDDQTTSDITSPHPPPLPRKEIGALTASDHGPSPPPYAPAPSHTPPPPPPPAGSEHASSPIVTEDLGYTETPSPAVPPVPAKIPLLEINDKPHEAFNTDTRQSSFDSYNNVPTVDKTAYTPSPPQLPVSSPSSSPSESKTPDETHQDVISPTKDVVVETVEKIVERDPYEDLDPFYKSSLSRFVAMLRREMAAETDEEKYRLFANCVIKETRLRKALYEIADFVAPTPAADVDKHHTRRESHGPAVKSRQSRHGEPEDGTSIDGEQVVSDSNADKSSSVDTSPDTSDKPNTLDSEDAIGPHESLDTETQSDGLVIDDPSDSIKKPSMSIDTPQDLGPTNREEATDVTVQGSQLSATEAPRREYTPFRYSPGPKKEYNQPSPAGIPNKAYSDLRHDYKEGARVFAAPVAPPLLRPGTTAPSDTEERPDETFLGIVRARSVAYRKPVTSSKASPESIQPTPGDPMFVNLFSDLRALLPDSLHHGMKNPLSDEIGSKVNLRKNTFGWIKEILNNWDESMQEHRSQVRTKRQARIKESENRIDTLIDVNHSYLDRAAMELELKQVEAQKQLNEERKEYEDYVEHVFKPVDSRLTAEVSSLTALQKKIINYFSLEAHVGSTKYNLSALMGFLLTIFNKLETTHEERVRNNIDLERRRKQAERIFFVVLGDQPSLKKLDKDFARAERHAALNAASERNRRTNEVMDVVDNMSSVGLGANQGLLDDILTKVNLILEHRERLNTSKLSLADETVLKDAFAVVKYLGVESENIVQYFSVAEGNLNNSDYDLAMWQARVRGADQEAFAQLVREKQDEDKRLSASSKSRVTDFQNEYGAALKLVTDAREEVISAMMSNRDDSPPIDTLTERLKDARLSYRNSQVLDEGTQERLRIALDEAKRRNAAKFGRA